MKTTLNPEWFRLSPLSKFRVTFEGLVDRRFNEGEQTEPEHYLKALEDAGIDKDTGAEQFYGDIIHNMEQAKVFDVDDEIKKLLFLTKATKDNRDIKLPFPSMFINVEFSQEELAKLGINVGSKMVYGILFREGELHYGKGNKRTKIGTNLRISCGQIKKSKKKDADWFSVHTFNILNRLSYEPANEMGLKIQKNEDMDAKSRKVIADFVINFINLVNCPDITYREIHRSKKNQERRKRQGKQVLPSTFKIVLSRPLRLYCDQLKAGGHFNYSHSFWVRGFWRTLKHPRYGKNVGKRMWVMAFVKGKGILIDKRYEVVDKGDE